MFVVFNIWRTSLSIYENSEETKLNIKIVVKSEITAIKSKLCRMYLFEKITYTNDNCIGRSINPDINCRARNVAYSSR